MNANNNALDAEPPIASFLKSMLIGGGPVNAAVICSLSVGGGIGGSKKKMRDAVPGRLSYELGVVPIGIEKESLVLATPTPDDDDLLHRLSWILNQRIRLVFCTVDWLQSKQLEIYGLEAELAPIPEPRETFYTPSCNWRGKDGHTLMVKAYGYVGTTFWDGALTITCDSIDIDFWRWLIESSEPQLEISENQLEALKCQWNREKSRSK